jgi:hypothetical protein
MTLTNIIQKIAPHQPFKANLFQPFKSSNQPELAQKKENDDGDDDDGRDDDMLSMDPCIQKVYTFR